MLYKNIFNYLGEEYNVYIYYIMPTILSTTVTDGLMTLLVDDKPVIRHINFTPLPWNTKSGRVLAIYYKYFPRHWDHHVLYYFTKDHNANTDNTIFFKNFFVRLTEFNGTTVKATFNNESHYLITCDLANFTWTFDKTKNSIMYRKMGYVSSLTAEELMIFGALLSSGKDSYPVQNDKPENDKLAYGALFSLYGEQLYKLSTDKM